MGSDENVRGMTKGARLRSSLLRLLGQRFAAILNIFRDALQTLAGQFRSGGYFLDVGEGVRIVRLLAKFFEEGIDLGENEEHFSAATRLQKEVFVERALQHEGRSHIPITTHLAKPSIFLAGKRIHNFDELVGALRPEFRREPVSSLSHLRFAAEIVEF